MVDRQAVSWNTVTATPNAAGQHTGMTTARVMLYERFFRGSPRHRHRMSLDTDTGRIRLFYPARKQPSDRVRAPALDPYSAIVYALVRRKVMFIYSYQSENLGRKLSVVRGCRNLPHVFPNLCPDVIAYSKSGGPNSNSRLICENCIARLRDATDFKRQVKECEKTFIQHLDPGNNATTEIELRLEADHDKTVKLESVKLEKRHSDDDFDDRNDFATTLDDDDDDLDDQPLLKLASKTPKKETENVDILDLLDNAKVTEKRKSSAKSKEPPTKKLKKKEPLPKSSASKSLTTEKKKKADPPYDPTRRNAELIIKYTTARPFRVSIKSLLCVYCLDPFEDPYKFRIHMAEEHKVFNMSMAFAKLQKSEYVKVDYTDLKCRICDMQLIDLIEGGKHLKGVHGKKLDLNHQLGVMPYLLDKDKWKCAVCNKSFPSLLHLNKHTTSHFLNYVCDVCGKSYVSSTGLLQHVRTSHQQLSKPFCRRCNRSFPSLEAKKSHEKTEKRCMPYCCPQCPERFPIWELKQKHLVEVHGCSKKTYHCSDCNLACGDRRSFYEHYKMWHSPESHVCLHCGLKFVSNSRLNRHLSRHTV
ncbi:Zinc finger protein 324A [Eumeta japonica]|uniref:Zinc finger protein 324A n=1 Tax=Eumeta variegata TaxID=151549 RepID=A0A4C1V2K7_EUMVA|nr:Zinc finger protein 324A [Eumeta japonica]